MRVHLTQLSCHSHSPILILSWNPIFAALRQLAVFAFMFKPLMVVVYFIEFYRSLRRD